MTALRAGDGSYHVNGTLTTTPPTTIGKTLEVRAGLGKIIASTKNTVDLPAL
jgi:hypothetical protein